MPWDRSRSSTTALLYVASQVIDQLIGPVGIGALQAVRDAELAPQRPPVVAVGRRAGPVRSGRAPDLSPPTGRAADSTRGGLSLRQRRDSATVSQLNNQKGFRDAKMKAGVAERLGTVGCGRQSLGRFDSSNERKRVNAQTAPSPRSSGGCSVGIALVTV
jgi:hypothetical protein